MGELPERITVLEVQQDYQNKSINKLEDKFEELKEDFAILSTKFDHIDTKVSFIHDKLKVQNGAIPHLQEDVTRILAALDNHIKDESSDVKQVLKHVQSVQTKENSTLVKVATRVNILWAAGAVIVTVLLGGLAKVFFGF